MRGWYFKSVLAAVLIFFILSASFLKAAPRTKNNVLLITIDTIRPDRFSCYSTEHLKTPHIDSLAERGIVFEKAFAHNPTTLPSHTNILLGTTSLYHGVHDNTNFFVHDDLLTLPEHLKAQGYKTAAFVGAYVLDSRFGLAQGFDVYDDSFDFNTDKTIFTVERKADIVLDKALEWLKEEREPWFVWIHCYDPHVPYDPPEPYKTRHRKSLYDGEVAYVDHALGRLADYLGE